MTDRDLWGLRGPVLSCRLQRTWGCRGDLCEGGGRSDTTIVEFRPDGSLARRWHQNPDGSEWTSSYEYDAAGRLVARRTDNASGGLELERYEYDAVGRLVRVVDQGQNGAERIAETYEYDAVGGKRKTLYIGLTVQGLDVCMWGVEGTDAAFSAPGAATVTTLYNPRDQPTELLFHDSGGRPLSRVEFLYDAAGNLLEESQTRSADMLPAEILTAMQPAQLDAIRALLGAAGEPVRRLHRYDTRGGRIETCSSPLGPLGRDLKTMSYNDLGDQIEEISEIDQRECNIDDEGRLTTNPTEPNVRRSEARFLYDYDAWGNWIKKVVEARSRVDQDFSPSSIEQRTLTYDH
jgi:YD repeat-containing protein